MTRSVGVAVLVLLIGTWFSTPLRTCLAQGTADDYKRADTLRQRLRGKVVGGRVEPQWLSDGHRFWYRADRPGETHEFILVDAEAATRHLAFNHARLAEALSRVTGTPRDPAHLTIDRIGLDGNGPEALLTFESDGKAWRFHSDTGVLETVPRPAPPPRSVPPRRFRGGGRRRSSRHEEESPDGRFVALLKNHNVELRDNITGESFPLSAEGTEADGYESGLHWAPDSSRLVALRTRGGDRHTVHLIESTPSDQLQPRLHAFEYLKPGDKVPVPSPHLFEVANRREIAIADTLFPNPWSLEDVAWSADSSRFTFLYNQRGHQVVRIIAVDAADGAASAIVEETSPTFVDYSQKMFRHDLAETGEIVWASERDGWNHLYLYDGKTAPSRTRSRAATGWCAGSISSTRRNGRSGSAREASTRTMIRIRSTTPESTLTAPASSS